LIRTGLEATIQQRLALLCRVERLA
jgi:hypothetical protein